MTASESISRLIALYSHLLDDQDYENWIQLFTDDGLLVVGGVEHRGRDAIKAFVASIQPHPPGKHFMGLPVINQLDGTTAHAWCDMVMLLPSSTGVDTVAMCRYHDVVVCVDGEWKFSHRYYQAAGETLHPDAPPLPTH